MKILLTILIIYTFFIPQLKGQDNLAIKIDSSLYAITEVPGGNIAFLITEEGVIVVDSGFLPKDGESIVNIIKQITDKPIRYLILTHFHSDHVNGMAGFPDHIQVIAHKNIVANDKEFNQPDMEQLIQFDLPASIQKLEKEMAGADPSDEQLIQEYKQKIKEQNEYLYEAKRIKAVRPDITFSEEYNLKLGSEEIRVYYPGSGHTSCNIIVEFSNHDVIHSGDLIFNNITPYVIPEHGADVANWIMILDEMNQKTYKAVIPGHGKITDNKGIEAQSDYFKDLWKKVKTFKNEGMSLEEIQDIVDDGSYNQMIYSGQLSNNIKAIYDELNR